MKKNHSEVSSLIAHSKEYSAAEDKVFFKYTIPVSFYQQGYS